jgi:hypothetical protein
MKVFPQIDPATGESALRDGCRAIVARAEQQQLTASIWSLAELGADEDDLCWLLDWAHGLNELLVRRWLQPGPHRVAFGTLLLLFATEYTRRALPRESNWNVPASTLFSPVARAYLFNGDEPSTAHRCALSEAAQRLHLRHAFRNDDLNGLRESINLQIGFTEADIHRRLPRWLAGEEMPIAIRTLFDSQTGSRSFQAFWQDCRAFLAGALAAEQFRQRLAETPWCLSQWIEPIVATLGSYSPVPTTAGYETTANAEAESLPHKLQDIFAVLEANGDRETIAAAVRAINLRADEGRLGCTPWSLAELQASDYDYIWLRVWVKQLEATTVSACYKGEESFSTSAGRMNHRAGLGCLLLLWLSETARRTAIEGELWPYVSDGHFTQEVKSLFFTQGQPTHLLRDTLQAAAERFHLRHVLHEVGVQRWLNTVFLQFGFTRRGFKQRLPEWLAGQTPPQTIVALLDERQGSASFQQLWQDLQAYRLKVISAEQVRQKLEGNHWLLPEWINDVMALASDSPITLGAVQPPPDSFITQPLLRWYDGGSPYFLCQLAVDLSALNLQDGCYDVWIGGQVKERLLRQADGCYSPVQSRSVAIPFDQPLVTASLVNRRGETVTSCDLELWPPDDDIAIYRLSTGERLLDAFITNLSANVAYALLTAADLIVEPEPGEWQLSDSQRARLYRLRPGWPTEMRALLDGKLLWQPNLRSPAAEPNWAKDVLAFDLQARLGEWINIEFSHPPSVTITSVRWAGQTFEPIVSRENRTIVGPITISPADTPSKLKFRLELRRGEERCCVNRDCNIEWIGAAHLTGSIWRVLDGNQQITTRQAKNDFFKICMPEQDQAFDQSYLMEGEKPVRGLWCGKKRIGSLHGLGEPLTVRIDLFNPVAETLCVTQSVVDQGLFDAIFYDSPSDQTNRILRLFLNSPIEPSAEYTVFWWDASDEIITLTPIGFDETEDGAYWECQLPEQCTTCFAVAIAFNGERLGAWWMPEVKWINCLPVMASFEPLRVAALLRWFRLPILHAEAINTIRELAKQRAADFLNAWIKNTCLPEGLKLGQSDESWPCVIRKVFRWWRPDDESARQVLLTLAEVTTEKGLRIFWPEAARRLGEIDPLLLGSVLKPCREQLEPQQIEQLLYAIAEQASHNGYKNKKKELLESSRVELGVDSNFVEVCIVHRALQWLSGEDLDHAAQHRLSLALENQSLREFLALRVLESL